MRFDLEKYLRPRGWRMRMATAALCAIIGTFTAAGRSAAEPIPVTVSVGVRDPIYTHLYVALNKGFLENEGLEPKLVVTGSGSRSAQLLATGQADVLLGNPEHVVVMTREGRPAAMLGAVDQRNTWGNVLVRSDSKVTSVRALKGTTIGTTATGGGAYYYAHYLLLRNSVGPNDVTWLSLGSVTNILGALRSGRVEAAVASLSMIETATAGGYARVLFDSRDTAAWNEQFGGSMPSSVVYALTSTIDSRKDMLRRFMRGIIAADEFIKKNASQTVAEAILADMGGQPLDVVTRAVEAYKANYWRPQGLRIGAEEYDRWLKFLVANGLVDKDDVDKYGYDVLVKDVGAF